MFHKRFRLGPWSAVTVTALALVGACELIRHIATGNLSQWFRQRTEQRLTRPLVPHGTLAERVRQVEEFTGVSVDVQWDAPTQYAGISRDFRPIQHAVEPSVTARSALEEVAILVAGRSDALQVSDWGRVRIAADDRVKFRADIRHLVGEASCPGYATLGPYSKIPHEQLVLNNLYERCWADSKSHFAIKQGILTADLPPASARKLREELRKPSGFIDRGELYSLWPEK